MNPSTPASYRAFLSRRAAPASQPPSSAPRFQSTPRLGGTQPTPRFSVPSASKPTQIKRDFDDVEEDDDRIEESSVEGSHEENGNDDDDDGSHGNELGSDDRLSPLVVASGKGKDVPGDSIELYSDSPPDSIDEVHVADHDGDVDEHDAQYDAIKRIDIDPLDDSPQFVFTEDSPKPRESKRRKMSISPAPELELELQLGRVRDQNRDIRMEGFDNESLSGSDQDQVPRLETKSRSLQQPVFLPAPRFKPLDEEDFLEGLPAAFSPQRRGAKYIPGGLASQLQGLLSEAKGWDGGNDKEAAKFRFTVWDIKPGRRMQLACGCIQGEEEPKRFLLAGHGKLVGLGESAQVVKGNIVTIAQPVWDVEVDGQTWIVACDWEVTEG